VSKQDDGRRLNRIGETKNLREFDDFENLSGSELSFVNVNDAPQE